MPDVEYIIPTPEKLEWYTPRQAQEAVAGGQVGTKIVGEDRSGIEAVAGDRPLAAGDRNPELEAAVEKSDMLLESGRLEVEDLETSAESGTCIRPSIS